MRTKMLAAIVAALTVIALSHAALATVPQFRGCDSAYYLDPLCKGVGVGVRSSGVYQANSDTFDANLSDYQTVQVGDLPDPDPKDPNVKTTAQWQAKWGTTNQGMVNFLNQEKSFTNTGRIFYVSQAGNDATGAVNDPTHPYQTMAPIKKILADLQGGAVIVEGGDWRGADIEGSIAGNVLTVTELVGGHGLVRPGDTLVSDGSGAIPAGTTIVSQLSGTPNGAGTYQISNSLTVASEFMSVGHPLDFGACVFNDGNPCNIMSGSAGHPLYLMAYPGEQVVTDHPWGALTYAPTPHVCCVTYDGFDLRADAWNDQLGGGDGIDMADVHDITFINDEFVGWQQLIFAEDTSNVTFQSDVFHDMGFHAIYFAYDFAQGGTGDFDFAANAATCVPGWYWNGTGTRPAGEACVDYNDSVIDSVFYGDGDDGYEPIHYNTYMDGGLIEGNYISYNGGTGIGLQTGIYHVDIKGNIIFDNGRDGITLFIYGGTQGPAVVAPCDYNESLRYNTIEDNLIYVGKPSDVIRDTQPGGGIVQYDGADNAKNGCTVHWIKNTTIQNNIIVTYNTSLSNWANAPLKFETGSYPETDVIQNNLFYSDGPTPNAAGDIVMWIDGDADSNAGAANPPATQTNYTFSQFEAFNPNFSGNEYADPKFTDASPSYTLTPGKFNFTLQSGSPVQ